MIVHNLSHRSRNAARDGRSSADARTVGVVRRALIPPARDKRLDRRIVIIINSIADSHCGSTANLARIFVEPIFHSRGQPVKIAGVVDIAEQRGCAVVGSHNQRALSVGENIDGCKFGVGHGDCPLQAQLSVLGDYAATLRMPGVDNAGYRLLGRQRMRKSRTQNRKHQCGKDQSFHKKRFIVQRYTYYVVCETNKQTWFMKDSQNWSRFGCNNHQVLK